MMKLFREQVLSLVSGLEIFILMGFVINQLRKDLFLSNLKDHWFCCPLTQHSGLISFIVDGETLRSQIRKNKFCRISREGIEDWDRSICQRIDWLTIVFIIVLSYNLKTFWMTRVINTVAAYRSLLQEDDNDLKEIGVRKLLSHITLHWIDIANDINIMYFWNNEDKIYTLILLLEINHWLPFYLLNYTSISMIMMRLLNMLLRQLDNLMWSLPRMSLLRF